jgi:hypothetical protein
VKNLGLTLLIPVALDVPVGEDITGLVVFRATNFDLLETPLRKVHVASAEVTSKIGMLQAESSGQSPKLRLIFRSRIPHNLDNPVVLGVSNSRIAVARNFPLRLADRSGDLMRVEIAAGLSVNETDGVPVPRETRSLFWDIFYVTTVGVEEPVVVGIFVVIAGDLLLCGTFRVSLVMGVKKTTSVTHVLESCARAIGNFQWAIFSNFGTSQVGLEKRAHLCIAGTAVLEDEEVHPEGEHVNHERDDDEAEYAES